MAFFFAQNLVFTGRSFPKRSWLAFRYNWQFVHNFAVIVEPHLHQLKIRDDCFSLLRNFGHRQRKRLIKKFVCTRTGKRGVYRRTLRTFKRAFETKIYRGISRIKKREPENAPDERRHKNVKNNATNLCA